MIAFFKDEGNNLATMGTTLRSIIDYELLKFLQVYESICFGRVVFKICQYVMKDIKFCGSNFSECERCSNWFVKINYLDEKIKAKGVKS